MILLSQNRTKEEKVQHRPPPIGVKMTVCIVPDMWPNIISIIAIPRRQLVKGTENKGASSRVLLEKYPKATCTTKTAANRIASRIRELIIENVGDKEWLSDGGFDSRHCGAPDGGGEAIVDLFGLICSGEKIGGGEGGDSA